MSLVDEIMLQQTLTNDIITVNSTSSP